MTREELLTYVNESYYIEPDYPWARTPEYAILRHPANRKWFCAVMDVPADKLGLDGDAPIPVCNLKCEPVLAASLLNKPGFLPAYHMNKEHWITIMLDSPLTKEEIFQLVDLSYELTK